MRIDELDEFQGLTPEMVRKWMKRTGWVCRTDEWGDKRWFCGTGRSILDARITIKDGLLWIAIQGDQSLQSLIREINPRMRKGMPSKAALAACANWLALDVETGEMSMYNGRHLHPMLNPFDAMPDFGDEVAFWPCDEHGNKVKWPTDAQGNML